MSWTRFKKTPIEEAEEEKYYAEIEIIEAKIDERESMKNRMNPSYIDICTHSCVMNKHFSHSCCTGCSNFRKALKYKNI